MKKSIKADLNDLKKLKATQIVRKQHIEQVKGGGGIIIIDKIVS